MQAGEESAQKDLLRPILNSVCALPLEKVFTIQVGTEVFRLSGASIASDAPSYFSRFFEGQLCESEDGSNTRTLYIDRDPYTFRSIAQHLQGYYVQPKDGAQFVKIFADAQFYSLPRLISQLFESEIFIQIGDRHFQIPRDLFSGPGDSPNFFTVGFAIFFTSPTEVFPGLDRDKLLRPPAIIPPCVPNRSGDLFAELSHVLRGYPLHIRDEDHRAQLLRDCRYYHLRGLEQKLIPHDISFNPLLQRSEIVIRLEDVRPSGVHFSGDNHAAPSSGWITYTRPFVDDSPSNLIVEIGYETTVIDFDTMYADFFNSTKPRISNLLQVITSRIAFPAAVEFALSALPDGDKSWEKSDPLSEPVRSARVRIAVDEDADLTIDGKSALSSDVHSLALPESVSVTSAKRKRSELGDTTSFTVRKGQWRIRIQPGTASKSYEVIFVAVKLDAYTRQRVRNRSRGFLTGS